jgi:hypothetical protein
MSKGHLLPKEHRQRGRSVTVKETDQAKCILSRGHQQRTQHIERSRWVRGTHSLKSVKGGISKDRKRFWVSGALTDWRVEGQVRDSKGKCISKGHLLPKECRWQGKLMIAKEGDWENITHQLEIAYKGTSKLGQGKNWPNEGYWPTREYRGRSKDSNKKVSKQAMGTHLLKSSEVGIS